MTEFKLIADNPIKDESKDQLKFGRYLVPLISVLTNPNTETPFTIGIFGTWGSGKTSLLRLLDTKLKKGHKDKFVRVWFNPWIHRSEPNLLVPLLHALHDTLDQQLGNRFKESAKKISTVLARLGADALLKHLTADVASLEKLEKLEGEYLKARGRVESEIRKLLQTLQGEANAIAEDGAKLIFFVDDLDRCEPGQIIDLLEAIKLFFDLEHVFIILAVDKEVVDRGIQVKYEKFKFAESRAPAIGAEYLEKMVQLPLQLFPLHRQQVEEFMRRFNPPPAVQAHLPLLKELLDPNPRKIKRILNILTCVSQVAEGTAGLDKLRPDVLVRLVVLQVQSGDLFGEVVKQPELLLALEATYTGKLTPTEPKGYQNEYGSRAELIQKFCQMHHRPGSYLSCLFKGEPFKPIGDLLPTYFAMFGGTT